MKTNSDQNLEPVAILAGNGQLPLEIGHSLRSRGVNVLMIGLDGEADGNIGDFDHEIIEWEKIGRLFKILEERRVKRITLAGGVVGRPELKLRKMDFGAIRKHMAGHRPETPGTTPVLLVLQVLEALRMIHEEGLSDVFERHRAMAQLARSRARELGFGLQAPDMAGRSPTLSALRVPEGADPHGLRAAMRGMGFQVAVGLGDYRDSCVRIGHMGDIRMEDVEATMAALESALTAAQSA